MVMSQCYGIIKYTLVIVNLIFWALGLAGVVVGVWMLVDHTFIVSLTQEESNYHAGLYIMIATGSLLLIVSFLGCCGAFRESQCMLVSFFSCLLVIVVAQIAAGAWLYTHRGEIEPLTKRAFAETIKREYGKIEHRTQTVDAIQSGLGCCGTNGPDDWATSDYNPKPASQSGLSISVGSNDDGTYKLPESCCKDRNAETCRKIRYMKVGAFPDRGIYTEGCIDKLVTVISLQGCSILAAVIGLGVVELIGLIFSLVLCCAIGSSDRYKA